MKHVALASLLLVGCSQSASQNDGDPTIWNRSFTLACAGKQRITHSGKGSKTFDYTTAASATYRWDAADRRLRVEREDGSSSTICHGDRMTEKCDVSEGHLSALTADCETSPAGTVGWFKVMECRSEIIEGMSAKGLSHRIEMEAGVARGEGMSVEASKRVEMDLRQGRCRSGSTLH